MEPATDADITTLNTELDGLLGMHTHVLGIHSSMGTSKTCLLSTLVQELGEVHGAKQVLIITYRQSLSLNMLSALQALGFQNYLDAKEQKADLSAAYRAIVQLDSITMVCRRGRIIPQYDLVILDEIESTLHHATAKTHKERQANTFRTFCSIIKASKRVLAMDAFLGAETRAFFKSLQLNTRVVRNTWRPQARTMVFTNDQQEWVGNIVQALAAGKNVAVASMSSNMLHSLKKHLVAELVLLTEEEVLLYDSAADDALKKRVQFVNSDWVTKRLVMWSPCIEAGVNFDWQHFHSMFLHLCNSTTPLRLMQMSGRIRQLENSTVHCMCKGLSWQGAAEEFTPAAAVNHIRWQENLTWPEGFHAELPCDEETLETGEVANLPSATHPAMVVASHNYARIINGRARFLPETIKLIEHAGHKWSRGTWHEKKRAGEEEALPKYNKQTMMLSARVIDSSEADALTALQFCNKLSREQKEALESYFYCRAWGISNHTLDAAFFEHHSAADSSAAPLRVLQAALTCGRTLDTTAAPLAEDGGEMTLPVQARAKVIAELLHALGITNVLDTTQPINLTAEKLDAIRTCKAFSTPEHSRNTARMFGIESSARNDFKAVGNITKRLAARFKAGTGIKLESSSQLHRQAGAASRVYTIRFDAASTSGMAQLLKLKYGRVHRSMWACGEVADYLEQLQLSEPCNRYTAQPESLCCLTSNMIEESDCSC
jgi:hypothetical protein